MKNKKVYRSELTPLSFLRRSAFVYPSKIAVVYGKTRYTYRELEERVNSFTSSLLTSGLKKHERVAFLSPNTPALLEAHFAVPSARGVIVAINTRLSPDEIKYIVDHSGARFLFVDEELYELVGDIDHNRIRVVRVENSGEPDDPYEEFIKERESSACPRTFVAGIDPRQKSSGMT